MPMMVRTADAARPDFVGEVTGLDLRAPMTPALVAGNTQFADMRAAWDTLEPEMQALVRPMICEHSQIFSRGLLGFTDFTTAELEQWAPVQQRLVRRHPVTGRYSLYLSAHAGGILG